MARHVPLYRALLELLRAISTSAALVPLLLPLSGDLRHDEEEEEEEQSEGQTSVGMLLAKMKTCVDTYTNRLRLDGELIYTVRHGEWLNSGGHVGLFSWSTAQTTSVGYKKRLDVPCLYYSLTHHCDISACHIYVVSINIKKPMLSKTTTHVLRRFYSYGV